MFRRQGQSVEDIIEEEVSEEDRQLIVEPSKYLDTVKEASNENSDKTHSTGFWMFSNVDVFFCIFDDVIKQLLALI